MIGGPEIVARALALQGLGYNQAGQCNGLVWAALGQRNRGTAGAIWRDIRGPGLAFVRTWRLEPGMVLALPSHVAIVVDAAHHLVIDASQRLGVVSVHQAAYFWTDPQTVAGIPR